MWLLLFFIKAFFHGNHFTYYWGDYIITYTFLYCIINIIECCTCSWFSLLFSPCACVCTMNGCWNKPCFSGIKLQRNKMLVLCVLHDVICTTPSKCVLIDVPWKSMTELSERGDCEWITNSMWWGSHVERLRVISVVLRYMYTCAKHSLEQG